MTPFPALETALARALDVTGRAFCVTSLDPVGHPLIYVNDAFLALTGYSRDEIIGRDCRFLQGRETDPETVADIRDALAAGRPYRGVIRNYRRSGEAFWNALTLDPLPGPDGGLIGYVGTCQEVAADALDSAWPAPETLRLALHGLGAPERFLERVAGEAANLKRGEHLAVLRIEVQGISELSARRGPSMAARAIEILSTRLTASAQGVFGAATRLATEDFAILAPRVADDDAALRLAGETAHSLQTPLTVFGETLTFPVRVGAALCPGPDRLKTDPAGPAAEPEDDPSPQEEAVETLRRAGVALTAARGEAPGAHRLYASGPSHVHGARLVGRDVLENGIAAGQFALHIQPQTDMRGGRLVGAEALVRWTHPKWGLLRPDVFIPRAEETGLIVPLGDWILGEALRLRRAWQVQGLTAPSLAINVSAVQLADPGFVARVARVLEAAGESAHGLELELTESVLIEPSPRIESDLSALRRMGFSIAIDDFGTGRAGFAYLREFPVDRLKIDKSFICNLGGRSSDASIVRAMIGLARSLGLDLVAEGVETPAQRQFLIQEGCPLGQGYLFSPPIPADVFAAHLASGQSLPWDAANRGDGPRNGGLLAKLKDRWSGAH